MPESTRGLEEAVAAAGEVLATTLNKRIEEAMREVQQRCIQVCHDEFRAISEAEDIPEQHRNAWQQCSTRIGSKIGELKFRVGPKAD